MLEPIAPRSRLHTTRQASDWIPTAMERIRNTLGCWRGSTSSCAKLKLNHVPPVQPLTVPASRPAPCLHCPERWRVAQCNKICSGQLPFLPREAVLKFLLHLGTGCFQGCNSGRSTQCLLLSSSHLAFCFSRESFVRTPCTCMRSWLAWKGGVKAVSGCELWRSIST